MADIRQVRLINQAMENFFEDQVRDFFRRLVLTLRKNTPKDTRLAASSWIATLDAPDMNVFAPEDLNNRTKKRAAQRIARGRQVAGLQQIELWAIGRRGPYVVNTVPYLYLLDGGSSTQAPAGFIRASQLQAIAASQRARLRSRRSRIETAARGRSARAGGTGARAFFEALAAFGG